MNPDTAEPSDAAQPEPERRRRSWLSSVGWIVALIAVLLAFGVWSGFQFGYLRWIYRDGDAIWDSQDRITIRSVLWSPPSELRDTMPSSPTAPQRAGTTQLVLALKTQAGDYDIHVRELTGEGWTPPMPIGGSESPIHSPRDEITPVLSRDSNTLYFASNRAPGLGGYDLFASRRSATGWEPPAHLGAHVNSPYDDIAPAPHPSGRLLAFASNRPRTFLLSPPATWEDVPLAGWKAADFELAYVLAPQDDNLRSGWSDPLALESLHSPADDTTPAFSPSGSFLYFASDRKGGLGGLDLLRTRCHLSGLDANDITLLRVNSPENVGAPVNTRLDDSHPMLFFEGFALAYRVEDEERGVEARFESRSQEVAPEFSVNAIPLEAAVNYAVHIASVLVSGILIAIACWWLYRHRRIWSMDLLTRCAAAAVLIHIGILYVFYFWSLHSKVITLRPQKVLAEVVVERALEAKITLETQELKIELPDRSPEQATLSPAQMHVVELQRQVTEAAALEAVELSAIEAEALYPDATPELDLPPIVRRPSPSQREENVVRPDVVDRAPQVTSPQLPMPAPTVDQTDSSVEPSATERSLQVASNTPRPGPVGTFVEPAPASPTATHRTVEAARTQIQAPTRPPVVLPPAAQAFNEPAPVIDALPVPAQSVENEPEIASKPAQQDAPSLRSADDTSRPTQQIDVRSMRAEVDALPRPERRWTAVELGLPDRPSDETTARLASSAHLPNRSSPPVPAANEPLPESTPVAAAQQKSWADSPRHLKGGRRLVDDRQVHAPVPSSTDLAKTSPRRMHSDSQSAVADASPVQLAALPKPGGLSSASPVTRPLPSPQLQLPAGEGGKQPAEGSSDLADVLQPRPSTKKTFSGTATTSRLATASTGKPSAARGVARSVKVNRARSDPNQRRPKRPPLPNDRQTALQARPLPEANPAQQPPTDLREVRSESSRKILVQQMGGNKASENAVRLGLDWLARCQSVDGRWDVDGFVRVAANSGSPGYHVQSDVALTGLAILCFLGQNHTPSTPSSPHRTTVMRALRWLERQQSPNGLLAGEDEKYAMYCHGIATLALSEAYTLTHNQRLREPLERALQLIVQSQNRRTGGWRYRPEPPIRGDTSISGWQVMALTSLRNGGFSVSDMVFDRCRHWLDKEVASGRHGGIYGYSSPEEARPAMVAEGMFARQLLGGRRQDRNVEESARYLHTETRGGAHLNNLYLVYYGTMALYQYQGWIWERWNSEVRDQLIRTQAQSGPRQGSWDPAGPWSESGGQVLATCFAILTLEVYYRYLPLFWPAKATLPQGR